jgi:hypothetical protein
VNTTSPWQIIVNSNYSKTFSEEAKAHTSRFIPIYVLDKEDVSVRAGLTRPKVVAVEFYTGPMVGQCTCPA